MKTKTALIATLLVVLLAAAAAASAKLLTSSGGLPPQKQAVIDWHDAEVDRSVTELIVAKNRNGPVRDIDLVFIAEQTAFREPFRGRPGG